ncbi:MAG: drug/metabolite exporter YedA [Ignavibacteriales bacterium]|nr:drug/metabolite exporter YedA [Ignavibacteriales bacterium]
MNTPSRAKIITAFAAVYIIWGSTYLGIRFAVESIPPFLMAGTRFIIAGLILYGFVFWRGVERPTLAQWKSAAIVGAALLFLGNGGVSWAEQYVPSGITALIIAVTPVWFLIFDWWHRGYQPTPGGVMGLVLGTLGVGLLVDPANIIGGQEIDPVGAGVLVIATMFWAGGSLYSRGSQLPANPFQATAMEMIAGGILCVLAGIAGGELSDFDPASIVPRSLFSLSYLIAFGSLVGFTAYIWLLRHVQPSMVATYAYVNPIIAVLLGWLIADEVLGARIVLAAITIVAAVALITTYSVRKPKTPPGVSDGQTDAP